LGDLTSAFPLDRASEVMRLRLNRDPAEKSVLSRQLANPVDVIFLIDGTNVNSSVFLDWAGVIVDRLECLYLLATSLDWEWQQVEKTSAARDCPD
jgi:hypothetical protein